MNNWSYVAFTALSGSLILLSGCTSTKEVSYSSGGMNQTFAEGKNAVPQGFEKLVYPGSTASGSVTASGQADNDKEQSKYLLLSSPDSLEQISTWYQDRLKEQAWQLDDVQEKGKIISLSGHRKQEEINVLLSDADGKTTISLEAGETIERAKDNQDGENQQVETDQGEDYKPSKEAPTPTD